MSHHKYCRLCSCALPFSSDFAPQTCPSCGNVQFHSPIPVGVAVVDCVNKQGLLGYVGVVRNIEPAKGGICFPGGYINSCESSLDAALREFREEVGLDVRMVPSFAGAHFLGEYATQANQLLFFYKVKGVLLRLESLTNFDVQEVQSVELILPGQKNLCFPSHQIILDELSGLLSTSPPLGSNANSTPV